jgi:hypothetical protein
MDLKNAGALVVDRAGGSSRGQSNVLNGKKEAFAYQRDIVRESAELHQSSDFGKNAPRQFKHLHSCLAELIQLRHSR